MFFTESWGQQLFFYQSIFFEAFICKKFNIFGLIYSPEETTPKADVVLLNNKDLYLIWKNISTQMGPL